MRVTVRNLTSSLFSTDIGLLAPGESKTVDLDPMAAYGAAEGLKPFVDSGKLSVSVTEESDVLDNLEPASLGLNGTTSGAVDQLFVSATGSDLNPGTEVAPFLTIQAAINSLRKRRQHRALITVGVGTFSTITVDSFMEENDLADSNGVYIAIQGTMIPVVSVNGTTGAFSTVTNGVIGSSSRTDIALVDATKTWTVDEFAGKFVEMTSGAALGALYPIESNTATTLSIPGQFVNHFSANPVVSDTYRIVDLGTVLNGALPVPAVSPLQAAISVGSGVGLVAAVNIRTFSPSAAVSIFKFRISGPSNCLNVSGPGQVQVRMCDLQTPVNASRAVNLSSFSGLMNVIGCHSSMGGTSSRLLATNNSSTGQILFTSCSLKGTSGNAGIFINNFAPGTFISLVNCRIKNATSVINSSVGNYAVIACKISGISGEAIGNNAATIREELFRILFQSTTEFVSCGTCVRLVGPAAGVTMNGTGANLIGSSNTVGINLTKGAKMNISAASTLTATTEVSIDGAASTLATMRAASPKMTKNADYFTMLYE